MTGSALPEPAPNGDSMPYWQGAREGKLLLRACRQCGARHFMPRHLCSVCWSDQLDWMESRGEGCVLTYTVVHRAPTPVHAANVPYVLAMIELDEGPRMIANIVGTAAGGVAIGERVRVIFEERGASAKIPQFTRLGGS